MTLTIKYKPGKDVAVADALSRLSQEEKYPIEDMDVKIHTLMSQFSENILLRIREETERKPELIDLKEMIFTGWPESIQKVPQLCKPFKNLR